MQFIAAAGLAIMLCTPGSGLAQDLTDVERIQIRESFRLMEATEERWAGWAEAPSALLLIKGEHEYLIGHPAPSGDFAAIGLAPIAGRAVLVRDRTYAPNLLATFPAVGGIPTIVIGTAKRTGQSSTRWIVSIVHEHFHQLQMSDPKYFGGVEELDLSGGDQTGMWMLNYPFPYTSESVATEIKKLAAVGKTLAESLDRGERDRASLEAYLNQRRRVAESVPAADFRYFSFQVWQEGIARFAQLDAARWASGRFDFSDEFEALPDFTTLADVSERLWADALAGLDAELAEAGRLYFYSLGALEGILLDAFQPEWRARYMREMFAVGRYFELGGTPMG